VCYAPAGVGKGCAGVALLERRDPRVTVGDRR
jgi:hypothetical protein